MHVDDCADACLNLLTLSNDKFNPLVDPAKVPLLNVGSGKEYTIKELVESIREISGYQGELVWNTDKPDGMPRKLVDSSLLHELLEWRPSISLKEGLQEVYEHYQKQPLA
jgi:GDP-L-fucose synthase